MDFPDVVSGSAPSSRHTCQFQGTICAYGSGCLSSETVQDGPFLLQYAARPARRPVATVAASPKSLRGPVGNVLLPRVIRGTTAIKIPLV